MGRLRAKLGLDGNKKLYWRQVIQAIPCPWEEMFLECGNNISDLIIKEHDIIKKHQIYFLEKLNSRELYNIQLKLEKPTAETYFKKNSQNPELEWKDIYTIPRRVTIDTNLGMFQYKLIHNIFYLNVMLYKYGKKVSHFALFTWKNLKAQFIFFILVQRRTFSGGSYRILSKIY